MTAAPQDASKMATHRIAAIYARVSTEEQTKGNVQSTATQVEACREKAAALGLTIADDLIVQEQHSGADLRWEGTKFMELVRRAERHEFTDLICLDVDRFCRAGPSAYWEQIGLFEHARVAIHWVLDDIPADFMFRGTILTARSEAAQLLRDKIREASMRNRREWARQGNIVAGSFPPFGFQFVYDETRKTRSNRPLIVGLVPDAITGPALLHITQLVADGSSLDAAKAWLEAQRIPTVLGAPVWQTRTIRRILHNATNYGGRRSFVVHLVERAEGSRRARNLKTKTRKVHVPLDEQYVVAPERVSAPPGLTYSLWQRAIDRMRDNKQFAARHAKLPEAQRAEQALLFGGAVRCAVCSWGLRVRPHQSSAFIYTCAHTGSAHEGAPSVNIATYKLDALVWETAMQCMRDSAFFERVLERTDAVNGAAIRVASLRAQVNELAATHDRLFRQLAKLNADDADDAPLIAGYHAQLKEHARQRADRETALAHAEAQLAQEDKRRASLIAFRAYAAQQRDSLAQKTATEKRAILLALRTRVHVNVGEKLRRVSIRFDIRGLAGASSAFDYRGAEVFDDDEAGIEIEPMTLDFSETPDVAIVSDADDAQSSAVLERRASRPAPPSPAPPARDR